MAGNDMRQNVRRARDTFGKLTPGQKVGLGATVMTIVVGAFVLTSLSPQTKMSPLYTDLDATDASAIVDELASRGVQYDLTDAGHTVLVPSADVYDLRVAMSGSGLPSSNDGYALLDKQGITTSEFRQRIDYQRALEGELSNTLQAMDGVAAATVHLALPEESVFIDEAGHPTASVLIESRGLTEHRRRPGRRDRAPRGVIGEEHGARRRHRHRRGRAGPVVRRIRTDERRLRPHLGRDELRAGAGRVADGDGRPRHRSRPRRRDRERRPRPRRSVSRRRRSTSRAAIDGTGSGRHRPVVDRDLHRRRGGRRRHRRPRPRRCRSSRPTSAAPRPAGANDYEKVDTEQHVRARQGRRTGHRGPRSDPAAERGGADRRGRRDRRPGRPDRVDGRRPLRASTPSAATA